MADLTSCKKGRRNLRERDPLSLVVLKLFLGHQRVGSDVI